MLSSTMASEAVRHLESVTDEEQAYVIAREIVQFIKTRPEAQVALTEKAVQNCARLLRLTVSKKLKCLLFAVLGACCNDYKTLKLFLRKDIDEPLMGTLLHLVKTPWKIGRMNTPCQEQILLDQALTLLHRMVSVIDIETDPGLIDKLVKGSVIYHLVGLLEEKTSSLFQYSETAKETLEAMILKKHLVGQVTIWDEKDMVDISQRLVTRSSKVTLSNCKSGKTITHLYDTTCPGVDLDVQKEHIDSGLVWPVTQTDIFENTKGLSDAQNASQSLAEEWFDIYPVHVEDGGHFWAQIGGQETLNTVDQIRTKLSTRPAGCREFLRKEPPVGSFVCAIDQDWCDGPLFYRGVVLEVNGDMAKIFAQDYGFRRQVPYKELCYLTGKMNIGGIAPQASLCNLKDVQPCPVCVQCLKSILAILCCLLGAFSPANHFLKEGGLQILYSLCSAPDLSVSCMAIANVSNLARQNFTRKTLATTTFLPLIIKRCAGIDLKSANEIQRQLLVTALGAMKNLLFNCLDARNKFLEVGGVEVVVCCIQKAEDKNIKSAALSVMKVLLGGACHDLPQEEDEHKIELLASEEAKETQSSARQSREYVRRNSGRGSRSRSRPSLGREASLGRDRLRHRHGSSSDEEELNHAGGQGAISGEDTDSELIIASNPSAPSPSSIEDEIIAVNAALTNEANVSYYISGRKVVFSNDEHHEIRPTENLKELKESAVSKLVCSFLNNENGGSIFFGIGKDREVFGIKVTREQKDEFRLGLDRMMNRFCPLITHNKVDLTYSPVVDSIGHEDVATRKQIPNRYVMEIKLEKQSSTVYTVKDGKCYFRYGPNTVAVSTQEIRQRAVMQEEAHYRDELNLLRRELNELKKKTH